MANDAHNALLYIAERLHEEALSRDWCDEYADFVEEVNSEIARRWPESPRLRESVQTYVVTFMCELPSGVVSSLETEIDRALNGDGYPSSTGFEWHNL